MTSVSLTATFSAAGTYTWTAPPGVTSVTAVCTGAGGGGGSASTTSGSNGGGGGGGEAAAEPSVPVTPGLSYLVIVGAGGPGGAAGSDGTAGTDSTFAGDTVGGVQLVVTGHGGQQGTAGVGGSGHGGAGGTGSANTVAADGGAGDDGTLSTDGAGGGGAAGASLTTGFPGNPGSGATAGAASGGTWPGGAGGAGTSSAGPGANGSGPGGGGGGALNTASTQHGGGNGADGQVVITWTMNDPVTLPYSTPGAVTTFSPPWGASSVKAEVWGAGAGGFNAAGGGGGGALAGSTTIPIGYGGGSRAQAATTFDGYVNRPLATTAQVVYIKEGQVQTGPNTPQPVGQVHDLGAKVYVCINPSRLAYVQGGSYLTAERANVTTTCNTIQAIPGINWVAILWNEPSLFGSAGVFGDGTQAKNVTNPNISTPAVPNSGQQVTNTYGGAGGEDIYISLTGAGITSVVTNGTQAGTAANVYLLPKDNAAGTGPGTMKITYTGTIGWTWMLTPWGAPGTISKTQAYQNHINYHQAFAPTVRSAVPGILIAYKVFLTSPAAAIGMFPGGPPGGVDLVMPDWYALDFVKATNSVDMFGASNIEGVADAYGLPLGLAEWGCTEGVVPPETGPNSWASFISHFANGLNNRIANNKPIADVIFFTGLNVGGGNNVTGPTDYKIPGIQQISDIVTNAGGPASGGAGGGGGEYAAEATLAISNPAGTSTYTYVVGAGGAGNASGANSTVAGDSVTVTGHGGSVATSTSAGGSGGSGSSNATHHSGGAGGAGGGTSGAGGGGGGSGGTSSAGNAGAAPTGLSGGQQPGVGGAAVTGGGPGGTGGGPNGDGSPPVSGPGGGGGGRGASGLHNGAGYDGQIQLSNFVTHPSCVGSFGLAPLGFSGTATGGTGGSFALAPLALSAAGSMNGFSLVQNGSVVTTSSGNITFTLPGSSTAGTLLIAQFVVNSTTAATGPGAPWVLVKSQAVGNSGAAHAETWMYNPNGDGKTGGNPGGITSVVFGGGTSGIRGHAIEFKALATGAVPVLNGTPGTATGGPAATSFATTCGSATFAGDLGLYLIDNLYSAASSPGWTAPTETGATWVAAQSQGTGLANTWQSSYCLGLNSGAQTVTGSSPTSTNETGWAGIFAVFTPVVPVTATGSFALAPLGLSATVSAPPPLNNVPCSGSFALAPLGFQSPSQQVTFPAQPLPIMVEILINGTWTDVSTYVYVRDGISITGRGRPDEASTAQPTQVTLTLNNRDGAFSPQNTSGPFYGFLIRNTQIRISVASAVSSQGAWYTGYRFWGEVPAWPVAWDISGNDVYVPVAACGVLQRMQQSKYAASPIARYYQNQYNIANRAAGGTPPPAGYWTCEDGTGAGSFASGIPGGSPMTWGSAAPGLGGDSNVAGSAPFATLSGSTWTGTPGAFSSGGLTYSTPGTYQWVCPAGVFAVQAECWGAGGGGSDGQGGFGGGGGEYAMEGTLAVTPGTTYQVVVGAGGQGGSGTFSGKGNRGSNGQRSTFTGDTKTVVAHGGTGGNYIGSSGNGGTGSGNATHHDGGNGGGQRGGHGGSGGGSSGGTGAGGHNGGVSSSNTGAGGGTVVTGGGPGGSGGNGNNAGSSGATAGNLPIGGPGGGGGGGGFNSSNNFGLRGGNGYAGQVTLTYGTVTTPPANVVRAVIDIPAGGGTDQANMLSFTTGGDVANAQVSYHTAGGGSLQFAGHTGGGSTLFDSGIQAFGCNGQPMLISAELTSSGIRFSGQPPTINWKLTAITPGSGAVVATFKGSFVGTNGLGAVTQVSVNNTAGHIDAGSTGVGHIVVQYTVDPILNVSQALNGHIGETAGSRFLRLCGEQFVPTKIIGSPSDTPAMGPQPTDLLVNLLQDCENTDLGQMSEMRDRFGVAYRTRVNLQNQAPGVILDYSMAQLVPPLTPTNDDQMTRNDIVATRAGAGAFGQKAGTFYEVQQTTGPLSVQDPPNGVGLYQYSVTVNVQNDSQLPGFAAWLLALGTLDEFRYPVITVNMMQPSVSDGTFGAVPGLDIGDYVQIINPPSWLPPGPISQLAFGFSETLNAYTWTIAINAVPEDPYTAGSSGNNAALPTW